MNPFTLKRFTLTSLMMLAAAGCGGEPAADVQPQTTDDTSTEETWDAEQQATIASTVQGAYLFTKETFNGNGRSCATCHTLTSGTLSPSQAQAAYARNHNDPLFRALDSDAGNGASYSKLLADATVTVDLALPANVRLADSTARTVKLRRGIPSTFDDPRFDPVLMLDGREPSLQAQAKDAIAGHAQGGRVPSSSELNAIADFEKVLFSSSKMANWAITGTAPAAPQGKTDSEKRGQAFFAPNGLCGGCHNGPMFSSMTAFNPVGLPAGTRFSFALVSEFNFAGNPTKEYIVKNPDGTETHVVSPDPGRLLVTGNAQDINTFKMVSLRNIKNTAPYFHDNSAKDLTGVMKQYKALTDALGIPLSDQDQADIIAYLKLM
jgi:cytochrome c peroxidase